VMKHDFGQALRGRHHVRSKRPAPIENSPRGVP
jgi:hypothetical protein